MKYKITVASYKVISIIGFPSVCSEFIISPQCAQMVW